MFFLMSVLRLDNRTTLFDPQTKIQSIIFRELLIDIFSEQIFGIARKKKKSPVTSCGNNFCQCHLSVIYYYITYLSISHDIPIIYFLHFVFFLYSSTSTAIVSSIMTISFLWPYNWCNCSGQNFPFSSFEIPSTPCRGTSIITSRRGSRWVYTFFVIFRDGKLWRWVVLD